MQSRSNFMSICAGCLRYHGIVRSVSARRPSGVKNKCPRDPKVLGYRTGFIYQMTDGAIDPAILDQLRRDCVQGVSLRTLALGLKASLQVQQLRHFVLLRYFLAAFDIRLEDALLLGKCDFEFDGDEEIAMVEAFLFPKMTEGARRMLQLAEGN